MVGALLVVAPWVSFGGYSLWDSNWLLQLWPGARGALLNGFMRGAVSGLGLVNLLLALRDLHERLASAPPHE